MNPTKSFISKYYYKLPLYNRCKLPFSDRTWSLDYKEEWDLSKNEIGFQIDEGSSGIDFLW